MKSSKYNIHFEIEEKSYIYNTLTSGIVSLPNGIASLIQASDIHTLDNSVLEELQKQGFIVSDKTDESAYYKYYYYKTQYEMPSSIRFVILPTYNCNLRCTYCYQDCLGSVSNITNLELDAIFNFIRKTVINSPIPIKQVQLSFYGGEPLLCKKQNIALADKVRKYTSDNDLIFKSSIITNATQIDRETIEKLFIPNDMRIQITIDGCKETHDTRRIYKNKAGSYDQIYNSIVLLNEYNLKNNIALRLNIDRENINDIENVFDVFYDLVDKIYIRLLIPMNHNSCGTDNCISSADYFTDILPQIKPILSKYGVSTTQQRFGKKQPCGLNKQNSYIIDCNLKVYKCEGFVGDENFVIGEIMDTGELIKNNNFYKQATWSPFNFPKCYECKFLPICAANCAYDCHLNSGDLNTPYCKISESVIISELTHFLQNK